MAAHAKPLTDRVTAAARAGTVGRWDMPARDLRVLLSGLASLGYDPQVLIQSSGLGAIDLNDPDARVSCESAGGLIANVQRTRFTPNLALEIAQLTPIGSYPLLDYLVLTSDTVGSGVRMLGRYLRLLGNPVNIEIRDMDEVIRVEMGCSSSPFSVEYSASLLVLHFRREAAGPFVAAGVSFRHQPDDVAGFERALGCPVHGSAPWNGVTLTREAWNLSLRRGDPVLRQVLETQASDTLSRRPARTGIALDVQRALTTRMTGGDMGIAAIARHLATSARTLQRRLADEGVSFQELVDEARKEAAGRYLGESALAISEVAYLVGYSEPAPFHRAFKRWYGVTPDVFRQKRR